MSDDAPLPEDEQKTFVEKEAEKNDGTTQLPDLNAQTIMENNKPEPQADDHEDKTIINHSQGKVSPDKTVVDDSITQNTPDLNAPTIDERTSGEDFEKTLVDPPAEKSTDLFDKTVVDNIEPPKAEGSNTDLNAPTICESASFASIPFDEALTEKTIHDSTDLFAKTLTDSVDEVSAHDKTVNLDAKTIETVSEEMQTRWVATIGETLNEGMTIKGDNDPVAIKKKEKNKATHITVNMRKLADLTSTPSISGVSRRRVKTSNDAGGSVDYELLDTLGEGGMGIVYRARQTSIDRSIALKMIKKDAAQDKSSRDKFLFEAAVTGDLDHPNIVPIHDLGDKGDGSLFYAMKHVKGEPWDDAIENRSLDENLKILNDVCNAIAFAHDHGIIHRDLKPENIMLGGYGEVLVMDWGLAAAVIDGAKAERLAKVTYICGTPAYMSPEMAVGNGLKIGTGSDIYLLGAILFEMIAGYSPHTGNDIMHCLENAARNVICETDKKGELINIAYKAMAAQVKDRYATVADMQQAIREYQSHHESISLARRANSDLDEAKKSSEYEGFSKSIFAFQEALNLWSENNDAHEGLISARLSYAICAFKKDDLDLALSQLSEKTETFNELRQRIGKAKDERDRRQRQFRIMKYAAAILLAVAIVGGTTLGYIIYREGEKAKKALELAYKADLARRFGNARENKLQDSISKSLTVAQAKNKQQQAASEYSLDIKHVIKLPGKNSDMNLVLIPDGIFTMGSPSDEDYRQDGESLHDVRITHPFYMGAYEVTRQQWEVLVGDQPSQTKGLNVTGRYSVESVSYADIYEKFLPKLQSKAMPGWEFDLPTEAEWEYACRAGSSTVFFFGDDFSDFGNYGWYIKNSKKKVTATGVKKPNPWGLYDVYGNVAEWCRDWYDPAFYLHDSDKETDEAVEKLLAIKNPEEKDLTALLKHINNPLNDNKGKSSLRVLRGGYWGVYPRQSRSAHRSGEIPTNRSRFVGFRIVLRKKK